VTRSLLSRFVTVAAVVSLAAACGGTADPDVGATPTDDAPIEAPADDTDEDPADDGDVPTAEDAGSGQQPDAPSDDDTAGGEDAPTEDDSDAVDDTPVAAEPDCSAQGTTPAEVVDVAELPAEVAALRDFLADAALRCDEQLLFTAIEESEMFNYSFGDQGDAIGFWWELESDGDEPYRRIVDVLSTTPALADGGEVWVWPGVTTGREETRTPELLAELDGWVEASDLASLDEVGYLGWRIGISSDGEWRFFVRGD